ncbi:MAG: TVP38/TMEM64 family protein [Candidatus Sumerlaeaceae bacterium]
MPDENQKRPKSPRSRLIKDLARVAAVAAIFVSLAFLLDHPYVRQELINIDNLRARFRGPGWSGELSFIGAAAIVNALAVPRLWVCAVAGSLYGAVQGTLVGLIATLLGTTLDFYIARYFLRGPIKRQLPRGLRKWYDLFNRNGFQGTLYIRFFPLANSTVTNMIGGASKVHYGPFMLATVIGFMPLTIIFAMFGSSAAKHNGLQLITGIVLFVTLVIGNYLWRRTHRAPQELEEESTIQDDTIPKEETEVESHTRTPDGRT